MNIAFDAKRAFLNTSGLGNYSRTLIKTLHHHFPENDYTLFTTSRNDNDFNAYITSHPDIHITEPKHFFDKKISARWRSYVITDLIKEAKTDVYHGLSNELPFNISQFTGKKIVTIHDLIFLRYPHLYPFIDAKIYNKKFRHACDVADVIIAISEETKRDIEKYYFIPEEKIKVIYQSCDDIFYHEPDKAFINSVVAKHQLPDSYLLYVGTIEERKNLLTIKKAIEKLKDIPLVIIGKQKKYFKTVMAYVKENKLESRVIVLENVATIELPVLYRLAKLFVFPSIFEGFGIPIVEALVSKTPVITTNGGCFPEAGGPHSAYINPLNEHELADKIKMLLNSETLRNVMIDKGFEYAQKFHPKVITQELMQLYTSK